jgi:hypothetical protein
MLPFDQAIHLRVVAKMPLWVRFLISVAGGALTVVSFIALAELQTLTVGDNLRAFFGLWFGPVSIFGSIVGCIHSSLIPATRATR